jgi:glycosyltransferase involved in cell wall biosynthesis
MSHGVSTNFSSLSASEISLIVCTRNRSAKLQTCLNRIEKIKSTYSFELVVIDNNSTDDTLLVISKHAQTSKIPMRWCVESKKGTGAARNRGAAVATSQIVVYLDDDCYPSEDFIIQYQLIFAQAPELGFVGGRVELYNPNDQPITIITSKQEHFFAAHQRLLAGDIISANMGIRKSALRAVNGWDEMFGAGTDFPCEDLDIAARILSCGWQGKYDPKPLVYHNHERKTQADAKILMAYYDAGRGGFYGKCLFDKTLRKIYLWHWTKNLCRQPLSVTFREIKSLINYIIKR